MDLNINAELEYQLVGSLLQSQKKLVDIIGIVKPEDFTNETAKRIYTEILTQWSAGSNVDLVSVGMNMVDIVSEIANISSKGNSLESMTYALRLQRIAQERRTQAFLVEETNIKATPEEKLYDMMEFYNSELSTTKQSNGIADVMKRTEEYIAENKKRGCLGLDTGMNFFRSLDIEYVSPHVWVITAYTSVGKTAFSIQMLCSLLAEDETVSIVVISTEMTEYQMVARMVANFTGVYFRKILTGIFANQEEFEKVEKCKAWLSGMNIEIYDDVYEMEEIERVFRKKNLQGGVTLGLVDYVQNVSCSKAPNAYQEGAMIAKGIQRLCKAVACPIICLSQVSNDVARGNTENFEAKGAGEWAAVTDIGIHLQKSKDDDRMLKVEVKKNRHGAKGEGEFYYSQNYSSIHETNNGF